MKRIIFVALLLISCTISLVAQRRERMLDSIKTCLHKTQEDSTRLRFYNQLSGLYVFTDLDLCDLYLDTVNDLLNKCVESKKYPTDKNIETAMADYDNTMASKYYFQGDFKPAIDYFLKSLKIFEKYSNKSKMAGAYNNIGSINATLNNFPEALKYYELSKKIKEEQLSKNPENRDLKSFLSKTYNNIGSLYARMKDLDKALEYYYKTLEIKNEIGDKKGAATTMNNIGETFSAKEDYVKAGEYFKQAYEVLKDGIDPLGYCASLNSLGRNYIALNDPKEALLYLKKAEMFADTEGFKDDLKVTYSYLAEAYEKAGDLKMSLTYFKKFWKLSEVLFNENVTQQSMELNTKYETEKKEQQNKLLTIQNNLSEETIKRQKTTGYFITCALVLALIIIIFIFVGLRNQKRANMIIAQQKAETDAQKLLVDVKNKEITDSIVYAKRIQNAILTADNYIKKHVDDYFIFYKPKDIVSGDFYWALMHKNIFYFVTADCTGHGVPGAMMSMLGINLLNEIVYERNISEPDQILNHLRKEIIKALNPEDSKEESKDGMDAVLMAIDFKKQHLNYAAANNPFYILRKGNLLEFKADKMPIGKSPKENVPFNCYSVPFEKNDVIITLTDGIVDQFGGPQGKKFKYKQLEKMLLDNSDKDLSELKVVIETTIEKWKGNLEQVDDICVMGIRL